MRSTRRRNMYIEEKGKEKGGETLEEGLEGFERCAR